jgi:biotin transport system substrate-specific component
MSAARPLTLADAAWPRAGLLPDLVRIAGASLVTALAAQVAIRLPWSPVLLSGAVLGSRRAFLAQLLYLAEGAAGLPVFAGGAGGAITLAGPTGGYLAAFPFAAALTGALAERGWDRRFTTTFVTLLLGSALIFAGGLLALARFIPGERLLAVGLLPFIPGDLIKSALAALAFPAAWRWVNRSGTAP